MAVGERESGITVVAPKKSEVERKPASLRKAKESSANAEAQKRRAPQKPLTTTTIHKQHKTTTKTT